MANDSTDLSPQLRSKLSKVVFAFRGYNVTNLGRTAELLDHDKYGPVVAEYLNRGTRICADATGRKVDLVGRVRRGREMTLRSYAEAVALIVSVELAQLELLKKFFGVDYRTGTMSFGYSLGEIAALIAGGVSPMEDALAIPLALAKDSVSLAKDVTLGVLFSRGPELSFDEVQKQCLLINQEGKGVIGISTYLAPNSALLLGQSDTIDRFKIRISKVLPKKVYLRKNDQRWPPLHTPIVWQRNIPNRAAVLMHTMADGFTVPQPPVVSRGTGTASYNGVNIRDTLSRWVDHPQLMWDVVYKTLVDGIEQVVHVGPEPNIIPATFHRLADNVDAQTDGSIRMRALSGIVRRPWLSALLPDRTALLRAPQVEHVILEDWLLSQDV